MEYVAETNGVYTETTPRGGVMQITLQAGRIYDMKRVLPSGKPNELGLKMLRGMLDKGLVRLVDTRPIKRAELR